MQKLTFLLITLLAAGWVNAQVRIIGTVKDNRNHIMAGANVQVKGAYDGGITDSTGHFSFKTFEKGAQTVIASNVGYKNVEETVTIGTDTIYIAFVLREEISELKAVTVTAGSFEAGDKKKAATVLSALDIATTGGANADITAVMKTLPGAQQIGEQEGLFVRGGAGYETKQFIDGTMVNNPYYSSVPDLPSRGRFSPFLFKGTVFSTGGYSALYGQALSSALILESIDLPDRSEAQMMISPIFVSAGLQELAKDKQSSWGVNYGYTNLSLYFALIPQRVDYFQMPIFHTADANFRFKTKHGGMVKFYTTFAANKMGIRRPNIEDPALKSAFGLKNTNWYNNLSWRESLGKGWKMNLGLSYSTDHTDISYDVQDQQNQHVVTGLSWIDSSNVQANTIANLAQIKTVFDKRLSGISVVRVGGEYLYSYNKGTFNNRAGLLQDHFTSLFSEADIYVTNALVARVGLRFENSSLINRSDLAPRISLAYKTGKGAQMSAAYGVFYQKPENGYLYAPNQLGYTKATHYIVNYIKTTALQTFRAEVFYKKYDDLIKTFPAVNNDGDGYAQGIEFFWRDKKTIKNLDYWISYSYLDTKRDYLNYPEKLQPNFAANHTASLVMKRFFTKINTGFNFTYSFATGRPYYYFVQNGNKYEIADQGKTLSYNSLGFSMNYLVSFKKTYAVFIASATNILNQDQVYGYNYSYNGARKEAVKPAAPQFYFIGCFLSWGVDRRQDAINNNL